MEQQDNILQGGQSEERLLQKPQNTDGENTIGSQTKLLLNPRRDVLYGAINDELPRAIESRWWERPSILMVLLPFLLYSTTLGITAVPRVNAMLALVCRDYYKQKDGYTGPGSRSPEKLTFGADNPECEIPEIGARASIFSLYMNIIAGLLSALTSPSLGQFSDRIGRRSIMILTTGGNLLAEAILTVCYQFPNTVTYWWLLFSSTVEGCVGSFTLTLALTHSYATDCTTPAKRATAFSLFHGSLYLGIAVGPAIGGFIIDKTDGFLSIFYGSMVVHVILILYFTFILPESLSQTKQLLARDEWAKSRKSLTKWRPRISSMNLLEPLSILWPKSDKNQVKLRLNMIILAALDFVMFAVGFGSMTVILLYTKVELHWSTKFAAYYTSIVNSTRALGLFVILPLTIHLFRKKPVHGVAVGCDRLDTYIVRGALLFGILGPLCFVIARHTPLFVIGGVIASFGGMVSPNLQSSLTKHSPPEKTGQLLGTMALLHALARVIGPVAFNSIYYQTAETYPQAMFTVLSGLCSVAWAASWFITPYISIGEVGGDAEEQESSVVDENEPLNEQS